MPLVTRYSDLVQHVVDWIDSNKTALGFHAVYYGDQDRLPYTPVVCVEPDTKNRTLNGAPRKTLVQIDMLLMVYISEIQSTQENRKESDKLVEDLEDFLHSDNTLGGKVIHSMVPQIESGVANKSNRLVRAARMTFRITTQELLPYP